MCVEVVNLMLKPLIASLSVLVRMGKVIVAVREAAKTRIVDICGKGGQNNTFMSEVCRVTYQGHY